MPTHPTRRHRSSLPSVKGWQLGDDFEEIISHSHQRRVSQSTRQFAPRNRVTLISVLGVSALLHVALLWLYFSRQVETSSSLEPQLDTTVAFVEFTPDVDVHTPSPTSVDLQALQTFHTEALERTNALERSLSETLRQSVEEKTARQHHIDELETERTTLNGQLETLTVAKADLATQLANERQRLSELEDQLTATRQAKEQDIAGVKGAYNQLVTALQGEITQNTIALHQARQRLVVSILDRVLFPSGYAALTPEGHRILAKVATILAKATNQRIQIEGHTDNVPISPALSTRFPTNWELSTARATEVVKYLVGQAKLPATQLSAVGRADTVPIASNTTEDGRAQNRRIEIILLPPEDVAKDLS
jgi:chemotaxis protein MotB